MPSAHEFSVMASVLVSSLAAITDLRTGRIPNWLTFPPAIIGIVAPAALGTGSAGAGLLGCLVGALLPCILYGVSRGTAIGGGDVKLLIALGALLGPTAALQVQWGALVLLSTYALIRLAFRGAATRVMANALLLIVNPLLPRRFRRPIRAESLTEMRMGPAIAGAVLAQLVAEHVNRVFPWLA